MEYNNTILQLFLILNNLSKNTFLVGGCVRDILLNKSPKDFDIVTDIPIDDIIKNLKENDWVVKETGKQFLITVASKNGQQFEIALFRKDSSHTDGRRPDSVSIGTIEEDAMRRDFTINSLYLNPWTGDILDPTGRGLEDLKNRVIRFNGKAAERIKEDYLRVFRAYRFASTLGFNIENKTLKACRSNFKTACKSISSQRILVEVEKMSGI